MIDRVSRNLRGYVVVEIQGKHSSRFINLAVKSGVRFWHYHRVGDSYRFSMRSGGYKRLRPLRKKCGVHMHVVHRAGLPFWLHPVQKRSGILLGILGAIVLYSVLCSHVWILQVEGEGVYTKTKILEAAKTVGVYVGAPRNSFDPQRAAHQIMGILPELEWASVNTMGSEVVVAVKQRIPKPTMLPKEGALNLVATKPGVVREITTPEGLARVKLGDAVTPGDLLVTGIWDSNDRKQDWQKQSIVQIFTAPARGRIMAETTRQFTASLPKTESLYAAGEQHHRYSFGFFGFTLPFAPTLAPKGDYSIKTRQENLWLMGKELPLFFRTETLTRQYESQREITVEEARIRLRKLLTDQQRAGLAEGDRILQEEEMVFAQTSTGYTATLNSQCLENIAVPVPVILDSLP